MPDSSLRRAAAPRLRPLQLLLLAQLHRSTSTATPRPRLHLLQLLLATCVRFSCCSRLRPFQLLPNCVRFNCYSPKLHLFWLLLPDCVRFGCCSPPAVQEDSIPCPMLFFFLEHSSQTSRFSKLKYEGRASLV